MTNNNSIKLTGLVDEDIVNYKKCSMFLSTSTCNWKCCIEAGIPITVCQNHALKGTDINIKITELCKRYLSNPLSEAIVIGGLEPFDSFDEVFEFIVMLRVVYGCKDDIIIYTGYNKDEITKQLKYLSNYKNIIIKYGRYIPNQESHYDEVLGVKLASNNQYAERLS